MDIPNVLRATPENWQPSWGDHPVPDDIRGHVLEIGELLGLSQLGAALATLPPGARSCPLHYHHVEEELFYVVEGELRVRELAPDADHYTEYTLRAGELVAYPPGTRIAHQSFNRSDAPVRYLGLSNGWNPNEIAVYPDSGKTLVRGLKALGIFGGAGPAEASIAAARAVADRREVVRLSGADRPAWVRGPDSVPPRDLGTGVHGMPLARAAGSTQIFASCDRLASGAVSSPLHWHTADAELLLVLEGRPTLRQVRDGTEERAILQPGDVVAWPAATRVAHQIRADAGEAALLVIGTCRSDDVTVFPERDAIHVRALGRTGSVVPAGYWDGEGPTA